MEHLPSTLKEAANGQFAWATLHGLWSIHLEDISGDKLETQDIECYYEVLYGESLTVKFFAAERGIKIPLQRKSPVEIFRALPACLA